jgi:hypothetical protein
LKVILKEARRPLGLFITGKPGLGKSSLLQHMILRDIRNGEGVCVIDPTADLVNVILDWIPEERVNDTVYFDTDHPIPLDLFSYRNPAERQVLTDQLTALFDLQDAPISRPRLIKLLGTLFDANEKGGDFTFLDIKFFLEDEDVRERVFHLVPHRRKDWTPLPKPNDLASIVERMTPFTESPTLRTIFGPAEKRLNIWDMMQEKKILLINLKDTPTDYFIGSLFCIKIQQATFGRRYIPEQQRIPFYLYIDECSTIINYAEKEFEAILTRARKYKLCLILATQQEDMLLPTIQKRLPNIGTHINFLDPFKAVAVTPLKRTRMDTPRFLPPSPASYAEVIKKRTGDNSSSQTKPKMFQSEDEDGSTLLPDKG